MISGQNVTSQSSCDQARGTTSVPGVGLSSHSSQASEEELGSSSPTSRSKQPSTIRQHFLNISQPTIPPLSPSDSSTLKSRQSSAIGELSRKRREAVEAKEHADAIKRLESQTLIKKHRLSNRAVQQVGSTSTIDRSNLAPAVSNSAQSRDSQQTILSPPAQLPESPAPLERSQANKKSRATRQQQPTKQAGAVQAKKTRVGSLAKTCVLLKPIHGADREESPIFDPPQSIPTPPKPTKRKRSESAAKRNDRMLKCAKKRRTNEFEFYNPILRAKMQARKASELAPLQIPVDVTHIQGAVMNHQDDQDLRSQAPSPPDLEDKLSRVKVEEQEDSLKRKREASIIDLQAMDMKDDDTYSVISETPPPPPVPELARLLHDFECHRRSYHHVKPFTKELTTVFDFHPDHSSLALHFHRYETFLRRLSIKVEAVIKCPASDMDCHQDLIGAAAQNLKYEILDELDYFGYKERCPYYSLFAGKEDDEEEASKRVIKVEV